MRPIDADALELRVEEFEQLTGMKLDIVHDFVSSAPTIDAVNVVRCKECKWAKANGTYQWCGRLDSTARITADDYCSYGEREGE